MINRMRYVTACSLPLFLISAFTVRAPALASSVQATSPKLEHLTPLPLHDGMNSFNGPDGPFSVFQTWRDNGNAWGYHLYLLTNTVEGKASIIGVEARPGSSGTSLQDHLSDTPHTGEDALSTIQFARGLLDGKPSVLLFEAIRDPGEHPVPSASPTVIYVYNLTTSDGTPGWTPSYFHFVKKIPVPGTFCSSDTALQVATGLPLSADAGPPPSPDGCLH
ncbi:hypothetical protein A0J51_02795 [Gluconobacter japonicus]|nr:hypothetical protein A0J51_02795 [Gluconobacter japonicus]